MLILLPLNLIVAMRDPDLEGSLEAHRQNPTLGEFLSGLISGQRAGGLARYAQRSVV